MSANLTYNLSVPGAPRTAAAAAVLCAAFVMAAPSYGERGDAGRMEIFFTPSRPPGAREPAESPKVFERLEASQALSAGAVYEAGELASPLGGVLEGAGLSPAESAEIRALLDKDKYLPAYQIVGGLLISTAAPRSLVSFGNRLGLVKEHFAELDPSKGRWARVLKQGIEDFLRGRSAHAVLRVSYALSLNPVAPGLSSFLERVEAFTGRKGRRIPTGTGLSLVEELLNDAETAFAAGRLDDVVRLSRDVLVLKPQHPTALSRLGSALFLKGRSSQAAAVWEQALELETRLQEREALTSMLAKARQAPLEVEPLGAPASRRPSVRPKPAVPTKAPADPKVLDDLYREGFAAYSRGDWRAAGEKFRKLSELDPDDARAGKALRRLESEGTLPP